MAGLYEFFSQLRVRGLVEEAKESGSTSLIISDLGLTNFNKVITSVLVVGLSDLQYIRANKNCFYGPLAELGHLKSLIKLNLNVNPLCSLSDEVGRLSALRELWLNNTELEALPPAIGSLPDLQLLSARGNKIRCVPEELVALTNLRWLILEDNEISELPKGFCKLENLVHINLNNNKISSLSPLEVGSIKSLRFLYVSHNNIVEISSSFIENTRQIKFIDLCKNPLSLAAFNECKMFENIMLDGDSEFEDDEDEDDSDDDSDYNWCATPDSTDSSSSDDEDNGINFNVVFIKLAKLISGC